MKFTKNIKLLIIAAAAVFSLSACSGGSTATGLGLSVGGNWNGKLMDGSKEFASFNMSLAQTATDAEDPFSGSELLGTFNSNACTGGGEITGTISGDSISLKIEDLSMTGQTSNNSMSGSWSVSGEECSAGGSWHASR